MLVEIAPHVVAIVTLAVIAVVVSSLALPRRGPVVAKVVMVSLAIVGGLSSAVITGGWAALASPDTVVAHFGAVYVLAAGLFDRLGDILSGAAGR